MQPGLQFKIAATPAADGSYTLQAINTAGKQWASAWNGLRPRSTVPGKKMSYGYLLTLRAVAGAEASFVQAASPLLAMSGYVQTAEPQYEQEHLVRHSEDSRCA